MGIGAEYRKLDGLMMFIIGVCTCSNIAYTFTVGHTPIYICQFLSCICLFLVVIERKGVLHYTSGIITRDLKCQFLFVVFSVISVLCFNRAFLYQWFVGSISLFLYALIIVVIIELKDFVDYLYKGLVVGIVINFIISLYAMIMYRQGVAFSLGTFFPAADVPDVFLSNAFRARGLFREQGHLMRFLAVMFFPIARYTKNKSPLYMKLVVIIIVSMMMFTASATLPLFAIVCFFYITFVFKERPIKTTAGLLYIMLGFTLLSYLGTYFMPIKNMLESFVEGIVAIFEVDGSNSGRLQGMKFAIEIIKQYPLWGCGWNCFTRVMMKDGYYGYNILGSYSGALSLIAELGISSIFFFYFILSKAYFFIKRYKIEGNVEFGLALIMYLLSFISTDYNMDASVAIIIALILIQYEHSLVNLQEWAGRCK